MKHFTVIELGDNESPMIGTIDNVTDNKIGKQLFIERLTKAICEHYDVVDVELTEIPDLFAGSPYEDFLVNIDGLEYEIRILETWIY